jgi:hypothetical protein
MLTNPTPDGAERDRAYALGLRLIDWTHEVDELVAHVREREFRREHDLDELVEDLEVTS